jgi:hypothetical protein
MGILDETGAVPDQAPVQSAPIPPEIPIRSFVARSGHVYPHATPGTGEIQPPGPAADLAIPGHLPLEIFLEDDLDIFAAIGAFDAGGFHEDLGYDFGGRDSV